MARDVQLQILNVYVCLTKIQCIIGITRVIFFVLPQQCKYVCLYFVLFSLGGIQCSLWHTALWQRHQSWKQPSLLLCTREKPNHETEQRESRRGMLTAGSAVPSAGWSWISAGLGGRGELLAAATLWFCSHDPRRRSCRGCQCVPPSLNGRKDTERDEEEEELGQEDGSLSSAQVFPPSHTIICG